MRRGLLVGVGALTILVAAPATAQRVEVTLQEAVRRALDVQPAMVQARGDQRNAGASSRSAFGAFLPTVTTGASAARSNVGRIDPTTGRPVPPDYSYTGSLNLSLQLFDGFQRFANLKAASATSNAAEAGAVNQKFQITLATKQAFYNAIANEELVRVADAQVRRAQQQLQISIDKLHAGSATRRDPKRTRRRSGRGTGERGAGAGLELSGAILAVVDRELQQQPARHRLAELPAVQQLP